VCHLLVLNPRVNILEPGTNNVLLGTTWQFYLLIKFHCRFQRYDRQQGTSIIEYTVLINDRSVNDFQIQWQGCKPESGEFSKYWESNPDFYSDQDNISSKGP